MSIFRPENPELILHFPGRRRLFLSKVILHLCIAGPVAVAFFANPGTKQIFPVCLSKRETMILLQKKQILYYYLFPGGYYSQYFLKFSGDAVTIFFRCSLDS